MEKEEIELDGCLDEVHYWLYKNDQTNHTDTLNQIEEEDNTV